MGLWVDGLNSMPPLRPLFASGVAALPDAKPEEAASVELQGGLMTCSAKPKRAIVNS